MGSPQKVVIPKGLVNPAETTIIEIPKLLANVGTVVARPRPVCYDPDATKTPPQPKRKLYLRKTHPRRKPAGYGALHEGGTTFGGIPNDETIHLTPPSPMFKPWYPISPRDAYMKNLTKRDITYAVGKPGKVPLEGSIAGFDPPEGLHSTWRFEGSPENLYMDFKPPVTSSTSKMGAERRPWYPSIGGDYDESAEASECYESNADEACPCDEDGGQKRYNSSTDANFLDRSEACEGGQGYNSSTDANFLDGYTTPQRSCTDPNFLDRSAGEGEVCGPPAAYLNRFLGASPSLREGSPDRSITQRDVMDSLGNLEANELQQIMGDLQEFQGARRRLVFDASSLASAADVSSSLLGGCS